MIEYLWPVKEFPKWDRVLTRQPMIRGDKPKTLARELEIVNRAFRETDRFQYQMEVKDEWLAPPEFAQRGYGDCEDFAIYRFYDLYAHGLTNVELVIGEYTPQRQIHAVCTVKCSNQMLYVLCNIMPNVVSWDVYATMFRPIYALSRDGGRLWK